MPEVRIQIQQEAKIRADFIKIFNRGNKQIEFLLSASPIGVDGKLGAPMHEETQIVPVDMDLITLAPPAGTLVEIADGVTIDVGNVPGAIVYAWLQWFGERLCDARKERIGRIIRGEPEPVVETPPIVEAEPDPNAPQG